MLLIYVQGSGVPTAQELRTTVLPLQPWKVDGKAIHCSQLQAHASLSTNICATTFSAVEKRRSIATRPNSPPVIFSRAILALHHSPGYVYVCGRSKTEPKTGQHQHNANRVGGGCHPSKTRKTHKKYSHRQQVQQQDSQQLHESYGYASYKTDAGAIPYIVCPCRLPVHNTKEGVRPAYCSINLVSYTCLCYHTPALLPGKKASAHEERCVSNEGAVHGLGCEQPRRQCFLLGAWQWRRRL